MLFLRQKTPQLVLFILSLVVILALVGFGPIAQGTQRFVTILTQNITVSNNANFDGTSDFDGAANFDGAADFDSTVDFSGATVTGISTSTLSSLTVSDATALNGGLTMDTSAFSVADTSGNTIISGTLAVTGAQTSVGLINANGGIAVDSTAFTVADTTGNTVISGTLVGSDTLTLAGTSDFNGAMNVDANVDADSISVAGNADLTTINNSGGDLVINDAVDITSTLQYGADNLYPLGYASVNQQVVCGTTSTFTATVQVTPSGLTTPTYVIATQVTQPAATIAFLTASDPTTTTFDINSWGADYNAGTTGVVAHWCAVGDQ